MKSWLGPATLLALSVASTSAIADSDEEFCGIFPPDMPLYGGFSGCSLERIGEPTLWQGLPTRSRQFTRLTFTEGHSSFFRTVKIDERTDGSAVMTVDGAPRRTFISHSETRIARRKIKLQPADLERINRLAQEAGVFEFERGSWDGDEIFLHCQTLDMERVNSDGYRLSTVNIGCNHPEKLMPLVNEIARLAGLKTVNGGRLFY